MSKKVFQGRMTHYPCDCPCKGCATRCVGCHDGCQAYEKYKSEVKGFREEIQKTQSEFSLSLPLGRNRRR
jgi:hypothetical protein